MTTRTSGALDPDFGRLLAWAYRGELSGEAMFATLADLVAHEEALQAYGAAELRGSEESLAPARAVIARLAASG